MLRVPDARTVLTKQMMNAYDARPIRVSHQGTHAWPETERGALTKAVRGHTFGTQMSFERSRLTSGNADTHTRVMSGPSAILGLLRTHGLIEHGFKILHGVPQKVERGVEIPARGVVPTQIRSKSVRITRKKMKTSAK